MLYSFFDIFSLYYSEAIPYDLRRMSCLLKLLSDLVEIKAG